MDIEHEYSFAARLKLTATKTIFRNRGMVEQM